jgi:hypothetical protein
MMSDRPSLLPLLEKLEANEPVTEVTTFPRGTLLPDGRLDLCKQSLGAEGTEAVARALAKNRFVKSLLLGADGLGDEGAASVARLAAENESIETLF